MRTTRRCYHLVVRRLVRQQRNLRSSKLANLYSQGNTTEFWSKINSVNSKQSIPVPVISGLSTHLSIANAFKDQYAATLRSDFVNSDVTNSFCASLNLVCASSPYHFFK